MTKKLKKWFKSIVDYLRQNAEVIFMYIVGIILGVIFEKTTLKYFTKFTYHGETFQLKDGDFMAWDNKRKGYTWRRPSNKD